MPCYALTIKGVDETMYAGAMKQQSGKMDEAGLLQRSDLVLCDQNGNAAELRYVRLAESLPQTVFETDTRGRLLFLNQAAFQMFGYGQKDIHCYLSIFQLIASEDHDRLNRHLKEALSGNPADEIEFRAQSKDGRNFPVAFHVNVISQKGCSSGFGGIIIDISRRKEKEQEILNTKKLESIGIMAGGIAHEFNNRLMSIQGNVSLMLLAIDAGSPHYEKLKKIEDYIRKGAEFTRQLISFARGGKYNVELTDINNIVRSTSGIFARTRKQIRICLHLEENMWRVEADRSQIELVLMNLYINAWQAMTDGGELHLETGNVILDEQEVRPYHLPAGRYVRICVRDNGPGIDKVIQEKIFDPFFTTHGMGKGSGLGLSAVYGIIKNHKGIITVSSEEKQGAAFYIFLPASDHSVCTADLDVRKSPSAQKTILFVDDEAMIVDVARQLLEKKGYRVLTAGNGQESLDIFKQEKNRIDLVILDMVMPVMGGRDTYICLKTMKPDVKALLSSGYSLDKEAETILDLGCNGFIQKPYTIWDLTGKIDEILDMP